MCGIVAWWNRDGAPIDVGRFAAAVDSLRHRGPDDEGYVLINTRTGRVVECAGKDTRAPRALPRVDELRDEAFDLALGHRRLSIVDLSSAGRQPMRTDDGIWIVFNGMIHNFEEIRRVLQAQGHRFRGTSDTEVILHAYQAWGDACVTRFNGMWAFVVWDPGAQRLFASRDHLGIKPLVYHVDPRTAAFASELKALVRLPRVPRRLDAEALHHYVSLMKVPAPFTIYEGVKKLRPARSLTLSRESSEERHYWQPARDEVPCTEEEALARADELLCDSVRLRLRSDVPVGALLSGGIDSSLVAAVAARHTSDALRTFNVSFKALPQFDESPWAQAVASHVGARHQSIELSFDFLEHLPAMIDLFDEPFSVSSVMGVYLLARAAARDVKVLLTGDGGDELFAGYVERYLGVDAIWARAGGRSARLRAASPLVRWAPLSLATKLRAAWSTGRRPDQRQRDDAFNLMRMILNDPEKRALYTEDWRARTRELSTLDWLGSTMPSVPGLRRWQLHDLATSLHDEMLAKVDKATMAWGVEARVPLLDHRLVDLALSLPDRFKVAGGRNKWILRRLGEAYLPPAIVAREKQGFSVPLSHWFRGELRSFVADTLAPAALRRAGVFDPDAVARLVAFHDTHPGFHTSHMVFTLVCFQLWYERNARTLS